MNKPRLAILLAAPANSLNLGRLQLSRLEGLFEVAVFELISWSTGYSQGTSGYTGARCQVIRISDGHQYMDALASFKPTHALDYCGPNPIFREVLSGLKMFEVALLTREEGRLPLPNLVERGIVGYELRRTIPSGPREGGIRVNGSSKSPDKPRFAHRLASLLWPITFRRLHTIGFFAGLSRTSPLQILTKKRVEIATSDFFAWESVVHSEPGNTRVPQRNGIVFVDDNLAFAEDWEVLRMPAPVSAEGYFSSMRKAFDEIESKLNGKITIAAHPDHEDLKELSRLFGGRNVAKGSTASLVHEASLVLLHSSTAASFAVLSKKPLVVLGTDELRRSHYRFQLRAMARALGIKVLNVDSANFARDFALEIRKSPNFRYKAYVNRFVSRNLENPLSLWGALDQMYSQSTGEI